MGAAGNSSLSDATLGRYQLQGPVGAGGMGTVYAAWDPVVGRKVAVKVLHEVQRFQQEREILAGLEHPHIARLLDAGETSQGRPWFAMEFVDGQPLDQFCDARRLTTRQRLELMRPVFAAVTSAHQHLVVHRDLKPGNILVTADGVPKLVDFGIARLLEDSAPHTVTGFAPMTPAYASPEQVRREPVATSSDVYSLGVVLHELLTGVGPYDVAPGNVEALLQAVSAGELQPCSVVLARSSEDAVACRAASRERLRRELEGDLDAVVSMALRREPKDRYPSVQALEDDVVAFLEGRPTRARQGNGLYRAVKWVRRHRVGVAALVATFAALLVGLGATLWQARRAAHERDLAQRHFEQVRALAHAALFDYHDGVAELPGSTALRERMVQDALAYLDSLSADARDDVSLRDELAQAYLKVGDVQGDPFGASLGDTTHALASYLKGREIARAVLVEKPDDFAARKVIAASHDKVGAILEVTGDLRSASTEYERARAADEALATLRPDDLEQRFAVSRDDLSQGQVLLQLGDLDAAAARLEQSLVARLALVPLRPDIPTRRGVAVVLLSLGDVRKEQGRVKDALTHSEEAERILAGLLLEKPDDPTLRRTVATVWSRLLVLYLLDGQRPRALDMAQRPLTQARKDLALDAQNSVARRDLVVALSGLARAQSSADLPDLSAATQQEALTVQRALRDEDPSNLQSRRDLCQLLTAAAYTELDRQDWMAAERGFHALFDEVTALQPLDPENLTVLEARCDAHHGLASALGGLQRLDEAVTENRSGLAELEAMLVSHPDLGRLRNRRALFLSLEGELRFEQAVAKPTRAHWQVAQDAQRGALEAFAALEKEEALAGSLATVRAETLTRAARCTQELR